MKLRWRKSEMYKRYIQMRGMQRIDAKLYIYIKKAALLNSVSYISCIVNMSNSYFFMEKRFNRSNDFRDQ